MARRLLLTSILVAVVCSASVLVALSQAGQERTARPQDQVRLLERIEKLEARVAELERRTPQVVVQQHGDPALRVLPDGLPGGPIPKGWQRREFNGQWYYDIPLGNR
jgi:hypothetical protein